MIGTCDLSWRTEDDLHIHHCDRKDKHLGMHICTCGEMHFPERLTAGRMMKKHSGS